LPKNLRFQYDFIEMHLGLRYTYFINLLMKGVHMHIRRNDGFHLTFSTVLTGLLLGLSFLPLTIFIATVPYYAYVTLPVFLTFPALFLLLFFPYIWIAIHKYRKKQYAVLLCSGIASSILPLLTALTFTFGYPYVHQALYIDFMEWTGLLTNPKSFSLTPATGHYLIGLASMLPGLICGIVLLSIFYNKKRKRDAEYHQPKKKNYYYI